MTIGDARDDQREANTGVSPSEDWDDIKILRWAHERLSEIGYPPTDDDEEQHPLPWWEARPKAWAGALEAQAELVAECWDANANTLGVISWKQGRS